MTKNGYNTGPLRQKIIVIFVWRGLASGASETLTRTATVESQTDSKRSRV